MPRSRIWTSVYNPNDFPVDIITYVVGTTNDEHDEVVTIPPRTWIFVYETDDLLQKAMLYGLVIGNQSPDASGGLDGSGTIVDKTTGDYTNPIKEHYEDLIVLTEDIFNQGFFTTAVQVPMYHFDSTEFIPEGAPQQIYGKDYTMRNIGGQTRVIFSKATTDGPSTGLANILSVGDTISFRYAIA